MECVHMYSAPRKESKIYYGQSIIQILYPDTTAATETCNHQPKLLGTMTQNRDMKCGVLKSYKHKTEKSKICSLSLEHCTSVCMCIYNYL